MGCSRRFGGATSYNKNVSGSAHFVRSDLHGLERPEFVSCQLHSVGLSKGERLCCGHVGNTRTLCEKYFRVEGATQAGGMGREQVA